MRRAAVLAVLAVVAVLLAMPLAAVPAAAQREPAGAGAGATALAPRRAQMERQVRQQLWQIAKQRIGFTDAQMQQLVATSRRYDERRRAFNLDERSQRQILRQELLADAKADQDRVAAALDRLHQLQRQRVDLMIEEQKEFATFMTPVQRAKYAALLEQVRRSADSLRRARPDTALGGTR